jgi:hypothetical protein
MPQPSPNSIDFVRAFMENEQEPLVKSLALLVGSVMYHNHAAVAELLEQRRGQFEAAGVGELLTDVELELRAVFEPFLNTVDEVEK